MTSRRLIGLAVLVAAVLASILGAVGCSDDHADVDGPAVVVLARVLEGLPISDEGSITVVEITNADRPEANRDVALGPGEAPRRIALGAGTYTLTAQEYPCQGSCPADPGRVTDTERAAFSCMAIIDAIPGEHVSIQQRLWKGECDLTVVKGIATVDYRIDIEPPSAAPGEIVKVRTEGPNPELVYQGIPARIERRGDDGTWATVAQLSLSLADGTPRSTVGTVAPFVFAVDIPGSATMLAEIPELEEGQYRMVRWITIEGSRPYLRTEIVGPVHIE
ncbi:MAG: hypothetical protein H6531_11245 [Actinobacteria bacterium]|nr:hypothetical protein [Thermoleophilia bacterium]MCB9012389.1 hypothetical protein [Actinomycetota bacterium]